MCVGTVFWFKSVAVGAGIAGRLTDTISGETDVLLLNRGRIRTEVGAVRDLVEAEGHEKNDREDQHRDQDFHHGHTALAASHRRGHVHVPVPASHEGTTLRLSVCRRTRRCRVPHSHHSVSTMICTIEALPKFCPAGRAVMVTVSVAG